ncbi:aminotransferase class I/II-fold pyridoxal phosphate-dependent enzyme [Helicovermis profundi]
MDLYSGIKKILDEELISFHVPGHKNGRLLKEYFKDIDILKMDLTEIEGSDNLHSPNEIILESQKKASRYYNSLESFFIVNGTTAGILSMISASLEMNDTILITRDCHKSVHNSIYINKLNVLYAPVNFDDKTKLNIGPDEETMFNIIDKNPSIKAVVLTYPSYSGVCYNINKIIEYAHCKNIIVLVDEAHGAHLKLNNKLPSSAVDLGGDIIVQSTHKMLISLTQSAIIHYNSKRVDLDKFKYFLSVFQSSSPSYLLMTSLDISIDMAIENGENYVDLYLKEFEIFKSKLCTLNNFYLQNSYIMQSYSNIKVDPFKINIGINCGAILGYELEKILRKKYAIQIEYSTETMILLIASIATTKNDLDRLFTSLKEIDIYLNQKTMDKKKNEFELILLNKIPKQKYNSYITKTFNFEEILLSESVGRVSYDFIIPYPPGIPILVPGEIINLSLVNKLEKMLFSDFKVEGITNKPNYSLRVVEI